MSAPPVETLDGIDPADGTGVWADFEHALAHDDGEAARSHLAADRPIYYCDDRFPNDYIRKWPDGHEELVAVDDAGTVSVIRPL